MVTDCYNLLAAILEGVHARVSCDAENSAAVRFSEKARAWLTLHSTGAVAAAETDIQIARTAYLAALREAHAIGGTGEETTLADATDGLEQAISVRDALITSPVTYLNEQLFNPLQDAYTIAKQQYTAAPDDVKRQAVLDAWAAWHFGEPIKDKLAGTWTQFLDSERAFLFSDKDADAEARALSGGYFQDGTYSRALGHLSPEGNAYGDTRAIREVVHRVWWQGARWCVLEIAGQANSVSELPTTPRPFGEVWQAREYDTSTGTYIWREYYWDANANDWNLLRWMWTVDSPNDLPWPGRFVGEAHIVLETDVEAFWTGYEWKRHPKHSALDNDEPERHLPAGFLRLFPIDTRLVWYAPNEIGIESAPGGSGQVWVNGEPITASREQSVFTTLSVLNWEAEQRELTPTYIEPETEYWIYLANTNSPEFLVDGLPEIEDHRATVAWDFKGKLFLSASENVNGYLGAETPGSNARLVGRCQTDDTPESEGGPYFRRELNISTISSTVSFPETLREFSDYRIEFVDENTLRMTLLDGRHGQIYVASNLYHLGQNYELTTDGGTIQWDDDSDAKVELSALALVPSALYFIYISGDVDAFNFNATNPATNRPWGPQDDGAEDNYDADLDSRLRPFLSSKAPDHGRMSEEWPGYWTRLIGQVRTDAAGKFVNARDLSFLNPVGPDFQQLDEMSNVSIVLRSSTELIVCGKGATGGTVIVCGEPVRVYTQTDANVHSVHSTDSLYTYDEDEPEAPLVQNEILEEYPNETIYLYLMNSRAVWGDQALRVVALTNAPQGGYLSNSWPGNQARWIATIILDSLGRFGAGCVRGVEGSDLVTIDDSAPSPTTVYSSAKVADEIAVLWSAISSYWLFSRQTMTGIAGLLQYVDSTTIRFAPLFDKPLTIAFADYQTREIAVHGLYAAVSGSAYGLRYCYLPPTGSMYLSAQAPNEQNGSYKGFDGDVLLGYVGIGGIPNQLVGEHGVYSHYNQPTRSYANHVFAPGSAPVGRDGLVVPAGKGSMSVSGYIPYRAAGITGAQSQWGQVIAASFPGSSGAVQANSYGGMFKVEIAWDQSPDSPIPEGVYAADGLQFQISGRAFDFAPGWWQSAFYWTDFNGRGIDVNVIVTVSGS